MAVEGGDCSLVGDNFDGVTLLGAGLERDIF